MADYDPGHQSGAWDGNEGYEVADGNQKEHIQQHSTDQVQAQYSLDPTQHASGDPPSSDGATDDVGDYDPASVNSAPVETQVPLRSSPQRAAKKKPRTVGGFLVGDSDSEDDEARSLQHPISIKTAQDTGAPSNAFPASQVNADATASAGGIENGNTAAPPAPEAPAGSEPQAPVDKIAQLEGRIRDDTRGALDTWLALIAEHRSRNDVEQARQTYERFFAVFPQAVRFPTFPLTHWRRNMTDKL